MRQAAIERFLRDEFPKITKAISDAEVTMPGGSVVPVSAALYIDFDSGTNFIGFHVPSPLPPVSTYLVIERLAEDYKEILATLEAKFRVRKKGGDEAGMDFSREVYLYHDDELSPEQMLSLVALYRKHGLSLRFKDPEPS
jgi:hypothetical protein